MEIVIAKYYINDTFLINGRGIVFAGHILDGEVKMGSYIELPTPNTLLLRKIVGIEGIAFPQPNNVNTGLCIACKDDYEIKELRNWKPSNLTTTIWQINEPIKLWVDFNASSDFGFRLNCQGTINDLERQNITLKDGLGLLLWDEDFDVNDKPDNMFVDAIARYNDSKGIWEAECNWEDIKHESEIKK
jgi:hypothetical protein